MRKIVLCSCVVLATHLSAAMPQVLNGQAVQAAPASATTQQFPVLGEWKLNAAKSDFGDGAKLRDMTIKFTSATPELIEFTATVTYDSGSQGTYGYKAPADGQPHQLSGSASTYAYSVENGILIETQKDPDGTITKGSFTRSAKGTDGVWVYTITNPDASITHQKLLFTKVS
ncbi:hypothetical protein [Acidicapsa ligni]|uniref:hypothetical protein n=1 Tax=Acidicapsa ligni TaxID=542300 RepID=UPI0021DF5A5A|nr:hypothetical protein [Acidicapsa ligni]